MLSYTITPELTKKLKKINEIGSQNMAFLKAASSENLDAIRRYARISNIGASTRIENATLTDTEVAWMDTLLQEDSRLESFRRHKIDIENKFSKDKERSIEEVAGLRSVINIIHAQSKEMLPLTEITLRGLHKELLQYYPKASHYLGRYKIAPNSVVEIMGGKIRRDVFRTADPGPITNVAMKELVDWYNKVLPEHPWAIAVVTEFVYRFLAIHPFQDGNGRLGRALFQLGILQSNDEILSSNMSYLAIDRYIEKNKEEYYYVLRQCSGGRFHENPKKYKIEHFLHFMLKIFKEAIEHDIVFYIDKHIAFGGLTDTARVILDCFKEYPEVRFNTKKLVEYTKLPRRTVNYILKQLVEKEFLQRSGKGAGVKYQLAF